MREDNYKLTPVDLNLRWANTYIGYKERERVFPFKVREFEQGPSEKIRVRGTLYNEGKKIDKVILSTNSKLKYIPASSSCINLESGFVIFIRRRLSKQYRWGLNGDNSEILEPFNTEREQLGIQKITSVENYSLLYSIFNNKYFSVNDALNSLRSRERYACAINRETLLFRPPEKDRIFLMKCMHKVAEIGFEDSKVILPEHLLFLKEEIAEYGFEFK